MSNAILNPKVKERGEFVVNELVNRYKKHVDEEIEKRKKEFSEPQWKEKFEKALSKIEDKELKNTLEKESKEVLSKTEKAFASSPDDLSDWSDKLYDLVRHHYKENKLVDNSYRYMEYRGYISVLRELSEILEAKTSKDISDPYEKVKDFEAFLNKRLNNTLKWLGEQTKTLEPLARELGVDLILDAHIDKDGIIDEADKHEYEPSFQVKIKGTDLEVTVFVEGVARHVDDVVDDDDFFRKPEDHHNYDALIYFLRTGKLPKEKPIKFIKLYRGMSSVEMRKWQSGMIIPVGKYFTSKPTGAFAYDDPELQKKIKENPDFSYGLEEFSARNDAVSQREDNMYITIKESKLDEKGKIVPV